MINYQEKIWKAGEYTYEAAYGFVPNIYAYLHEDDSPRPCLLVVPGGGYCMVCNVEGEPMARIAYEDGMNVFVLTYTTDITMSVPLRNQPLKDISRAIRYIRANSERFHIIPNKLSIIGSSAGGHLCASICTHYAELEDCDAELNKQSNRPDSSILCYPVITSGEFTHIYSIQALIGTSPSQEELEYFSLEKQVTPNTPPCFIWQTVEDDLVPVENSMLYAEALRRNKVPYAYYAFPHGRHGLSVANEDVWTGNFGAPYTFEQVDRAIENVKNYTAVNVSQQRHDELMLQFFGNLEGIRKEPENKEQLEAAPASKPAEAVSEAEKYSDVAVWPSLCRHWLKSIDML